MPDSRPLAAALFVFLIVSCGGNPQVLVPIDTDVRSGFFEEALEAINAERNRGRGGRRGIYRSPRNDILFYLDRGMVLHFAGMFEESIRDLHRAEQLIEEAFTISLTQEMGTFLLNDNVRDYSGEDYEDLYINVFNALNFFHLGDIEGALVEIRRLNLKLNFLADRHERVKRRVTDSNPMIDIRNIPMEASRFSNSALARYLGVLFYRATGRHDSARVDFEELHRAFELAPQVYNHPIPSSVADELFVPPGLGRLNVIAFTGLSPVKERENLFLPLPFPPPHHFIRFEYPVMVSRPQTIFRVEAVLDNGKRFPLELLEDMGAVARETFKSRQGTIILKTVARTIAKHTGTAVTAAAVTRNSGEGWGLLVSILGRIATEITEQADLRLSRFFPSQALVGGINLEPGKYFLTVNFYGSRGLVFSERREIIVNERGLNLEQFVCLK